MVRRGYNRNISGRDDSDNPLYHSLKHAAEKIQKSPEDDFDKIFIVPDEEIFFIDGQERAVENATHAMKGDEEYVLIDNTWYPITYETEEVVDDSENEEEVYDSEGDEKPVDSDYTPEPQYYEESVKPSSETGMWGSVILVIIFAILVFLFAGPLITVILSGSSDPDNENIISPTTHVPEQNPTTEPTQVQSKESERATKIKNAMDYSNPVTRDYALTLIPNSHGGKYNIAQICDLWEAVYKKWTYVNDPRGSDYYSPASRTIELGLKGDCDDFAITIGSLIQSIGGTSRIVTAYNLKNGHAYPEVFIGTTEQSRKNVASYISKRYKTNKVAFHTRSKNGVTEYWLNLDWQSKYPGGEFFDDTGEKTIYYPDGHWIKSN